MRNPLHTPLFTVFENEVRLASKRIAPYVLMVLFAGHAMLWWSHGPAVRLGWATNSEYYIVRNLLGYSFLLGLPIFNAVIMGDPVLRDFSTGVDSLIFSQPLSRVQYLLGKFFGNFFVLVCCQAVFPLTLMVLQAFRTSEMIVQPVKVVPYFKHFFFFVVISHLFLAVIYFSVGTLSRNTKIVYGLAVSFYPVYISYQVFLLKSLPTRWQLLLDPMLLNSSLKGNGFLHSADFLNRLVIIYTPVMIANRTLVLVAVAICLTFLYLRFTIEEKPRANTFSLLNLSPVAERISSDSEILPPASYREYNADAAREPVLLPLVNTGSGGVRADLRKLEAALGVEFRLLLSERSLIVIMPLAILISTLEVAFWTVVPDPSYSAAYAGNTARSLTLFMLGVAVIYTGEAMHRDRDLRIQSLLWSQPVPNYVLLLSKFIATLLLILGLVLLVALISIALQLGKQNGPIEFMAYLRIYGLVLLPNAIFLAAAALVLNVLLRDRYLTYAVAIGTAAGLFYLYTQGHNQWLYNPLMVQLWDYPSLISGPDHSTVLANRVYVLALSGLFLALTQLLFQRKSNRTSIASAIAVDRINS